MSQVLDWANEEIKVKNIDFELVNEVLTWYGYKKYMSCSVQCAVQVQDFSHQQ